MEFINIYAPSKLETKQFHTNHTPNKDSFLAGDFNRHHPNWYGELAPDRSGVILASSRSAEFLVDWTDQHQYQVLNTPGTCTHFPRNGSQRTIPDHTFVKGRAAHITKSWSADIGEGGDSDHAPLTTLMTIDPPTFQPKRRMHAGDWKLFQEHIKTAPALCTDSPEATVKAAADVQRIIQQAIDKAVPMSTTGKTSKAWWTTDITKAKSELARAKKEAGMDPKSEEEKARQKELAT